MKRIEDTDKRQQFSGGRISQLALRALGWKLIFKGLPGPHGILIVYPHTSNMDFFIGILAKWAIGMPVHFLAKDSLFKIPLIAWWLRYVGGRPVVRSSPQGYVAQLAQEMQASDYFWLVITPEGTRKKTPGWRSGFYRLAQMTGYPVGFAYIDYAKKEIGVKDYAVLDGPLEADFAHIQSIYADKVGKYPENRAPIVLWSPKDGK
jgi:hypothetical protein